MDGRRKIQTRSEFQRVLRGLDGKPYPGYRDLRGGYDLGVYRLWIDHVQPDPFAPPSRVRVQADADLLRLPREYAQETNLRIAAEDFLTRRLVLALEALGKQRRGSGRSGVILVDTPLQTVLPRSSVRIGDDDIEARLSVGLPADVRRIRAKDAEAMFLEDIPFLLHRALSRADFPFSELEEHAALYCDQDHLRRGLRDRGLVAFIGEGSVLARRSGVSELPMDLQLAERFASPPSLKVNWRLPSGREISGMGIPHGVTLIVGGGFHGKSTLLQAIVRGVYSHIAGDGREWCITDAAAVKVRAEDGRRVARVDISGFISHLPRGRGTSAFSTQDASGSTSQAAAIVEAMELGATALLMDEDTSAGNFLVRDARMQSLVAKDREPITPFVDRVRELYEAHGVSTVLVVGGSGDYLDVADVVIQMDEYRPRDVTQEAREVTRRMPTQRQPEAQSPLNPVRPRAPQPLRRGQRMDRMDVKSRTVVQFGDEFADLGALDQLIDESQSRGAAVLVRHALQRYVDGKAPLREVCERAVLDVLERGFVSVSPFEGCSGFYALPRAIEIGQIWNRVRGLAVR